jgi:dihydroorotate dehydrogenase (fumarate)
MDLSTTYLGLSLPHPFIAGSSPLTNRPDNIRQLEDAGIAAVVLLPLFEEQLRTDQMALFDSTDPHDESFPEALSYFVEPERALVDSESYMEHLASIRRSVHVPIIAAINAVTPAKWVDFALRMEQAGADALELDFYHVAIDARESGESIEQRRVDVVKAVKGAVRIPVAVKVTPFHTSLAHFSRRLEEAGADGLVLLHRFYEPDLDIDNLEALSTFKFSDSRELLLRLRWLAIISEKTGCYLAACGGVHTAEDTVKAVMTGADCVQLGSALMKNGLGHISVLREGLATWLERHEYDSLSRVRGTMNLERIPNPEILSRANYMNLLSSWDLGSWAVDIGRASSPVRKHKHEASRPDYPLHVGGRS